MGKFSGERNRQKDSYDKNTKKAAKHKKPPRGLNIEPDPVRNLTEHMIPTTKRGNDGMQYIW